MKDHLTDMLDSKNEENRICKSSYSKFLFFFFEWATVTWDPDKSWLISERITLGAYTCQSQNKRAI